MEIECPARASSLFKEHRPAGEELFVQFRHGGLKFGYMHRTDRMVFRRANPAAGLGGGHASTNKGSLVGGIFESGSYLAALYSAEPTTSSK
jgi:hypothetical protein